MTDLVSILFNELKYVDFAKEASKIKLPKYSKINSGFIIEKIIRNYIHSIDSIKNEFDFSLNSNLNNFIISNTGGFQLKCPKSKRCIYEIDDILTRNKKNLNLIEIKAGKISDKYFNSKLKKSSETKTDISYILKQTKNFDYIPKLFVIYNDRETKVLKKSIRNIEKQKQNEVYFLSYENKYEREVLDIVNLHNYKIVKENKLRELELTREFGLNLELVY